ncbi:carbohydrate ABC transporter permease [Actinopolymorpha pittospori]|uniref:Cellobiose transport system permease protein n=1 Tax=Actinopolymorpha pittospori TaxID=648752 RepID=A0A927RAJ1_9ACTN|nr:sugar ABC transporter permease [Actinopolymorpha pittospori]MBE1605100.1 cellobiose transport system permease protein [Actinopolymorpha pittospori]
MTTTPLAAPASAGEPGSTARRHAGRSKSELFSLYLAISPFYILFAIFGLFPILFSFYLSFQNWNGIGDMHFVGLAQYQFMLSDPTFWKSILNTFEIWFISTIPMLFFALVIAFLLNQKIRGRSAYRIAFFIPNVTSIVAIAIIFGSIFANQFGLTNALLSSLHLDTIEWLNTPWGIKFSIAAMVVWRWTGYNAIIYLAGLQAIPTELYEAARVDGASLRQVFFRITVPMLRPIILFTVITSTIGGMQLFTEPQVLVGNGGGPGNEGQTMVLYLYEQAFVNNQFGYGAAIGWGLFVIMIAFSLINWRLVQGRGERGPKGVRA